METIEIKHERTVLSTKTLYEGSFNKIEVNKYWDSHGREIDWGKETNNYDTPAQVKITSSIVRFDFGEHIKPQTWEIWNIYVNGKRFDTEFELTGYRALKSKLVLSACVGAG